MGQALVIQETFRRQFQMYGPTPPVTVPEATSEFVSESFTIAGGSCDAATVERLLNEQIGSLQKAAESQAIRDDVARVAAEFANKNLDGGEYIRRHQALNVDAHSRTQEMTDITFAVVSWATDEGGRCGEEEDDGNDDASAPVGVNIRVSWTIYKASLQLDQAYQLNELHHSRTGERRYKFCGPRKTYRWTTLEATPRGLNASEIDAVQTSLSRGLLAAIEQPPLLDVAGGGSAV